MQELISQGIVLRSLDYHDNDKIITILTPEHGRLTAILKGVKKVTAKMKFASQVFCYAQFKLVGKGEMLTVSGATEIESFFDIVQDYKAMRAGSAMLEIADGVSFIHEPDHLLFSGLLRALETLSKTETDPDVVLMRFALGVFKITGYAMNLRTCGTCGKSLNADIVRFDVETGEFTCIHCSKGSYIPVSPRTLEVMQNLPKLEFDQLENIVITDTEAREFKTIIRANFACRFGKNLKTLSSV